MTSGRAAGRAAPLAILHAIPSMGGGGAERQLALLAGAQVARGLDVTVALLHDGPNLPRLEASGARVVRIAARSNYDARIIARLGDLIRSHRPDLVQTWLPQMDTFGGLAAVSARVPFVVSERSSAEAYVSRCVDRWPRRLVARRARGIIANSPAGAAYWSVGAYRALPKWVIPNALPPELFAAARASGGQRRDGGPLLYVGRFSPEKNVVTLVEALRDVAAAVPDLEIRLVGEGPERPRIEALLLEHGLARRVQVLRYQSDLWPLLAGARLLVSPSRFEGQPNTVLEAMALGCPLVVSDIPGHRALLGDGAARFAPAHSAGALADAIRDALAHPDATAARAARAAGLAQQFTIERAAGAYIEAYQELVRSSGNLREPPKSLATCAAS